MKDTSQRVRWVVIWILIALGSFLTLWGFWPPARTAIEIPLQPSGPQWALPEERILRLEFSPAPRAGDAQIIELRIVPAEATRVVKNIYDEYTVIVEARLDMPIAEVRPAGVISASLVEGGSATFYWEISPRAGGNVDGTVWTFLRFIPHDGGAEIRQAVAAQVVSIRPRYLMGQTGSEARMWGVAGLAVGLLLGWLSLRAGKPALGAN